MSQPIPNFLTGYESQWASDPRSATEQWFREARYGLFLHYGLYSLLGRHEWVQLREKIYVDEYERLAAEFTAEGFDADAIAQLAVDAGMKYVNLTTRHHDSFCLFRTDQTDFNSVVACGRDLVAELAEACDKHGLGLFLYYSHGRDWRHPHAPNNDRYGGQARPEYDPPEPRYAYGPEHDLQRYVDFMSAQVTELLTQYAPVAGIWLDGIAVPLHGDKDAFHCQDLYDLVHDLSPYALVSYKQGLLGTEDFFAPEHKSIGKLDKPCEICTTMCPGSWGFLAGKRGEHKSADDVWETLSYALGNNCNLLLNTGPLPDGSLDPEDTQVLREVGRRIAAEGYPGEQN